MWLWLWQRKVWVYEICIELTVLALVFTAQLVLAATYAVMAALSIVLLRLAQRVSTSPPEFRRRSNV